MDLANLLTGVPKPYTTTYHKRSLQAPPSPPVEEQVKCSLPSISSLLEGADGQHAVKRQRMSPSLSRDRDVHYDTIHLPPTPPLRPGSGAGYTRSPEMSTKPTHHPHRSSVSSTGSAPLSHSGPYASPAPSVFSYSSPIDAQAPVYFSRPPTASTFQPATPVSAPQMPQQSQPSHSRSHSQQPAPQVQVHHHHQQPQQASAPRSPSLISPVTPAWQHHHYFPPSSSTTYQQNHDRYICRTCHKAFSRPSSLRIHSHSHTGEKPFRCTHAGCGKAFSVRSNMKRHERGCHSGRPVVPIAPAAPTALVS
ncbi:hypothetical protein N7454_002884 [Penicillium verhagenii]|nr:hypothetical protein N7454_002884 [Penicillium verhagenii]